MNISCSSCGAHYRIQSAKIKADVSRATCRKCGAIILLRKGMERFEAQQESEDEGIVNHSDERTVITEVPELKEFQATPILDAHVGSPAIPVKVARNQSVDTMASQSARSGEVVSTRLEAQLFGNASEAAPVITVEAADGEKPGQAHKAVPLPAGARMVASMKSAGPHEAPKAASESSRKPEPVASVQAEPSAAPVDMVSAQELSSFPSSVSLLGAPPSMDPVPRELRQAMATRGKKSAAAATSMHMGLTAQYESMVKNGLPPGFASARSTHEVTMPITTSSAVTAGNGKRKGSQTTQKTTSAPIPQENPRSERGPKIVAGMLSVMAFCSVVMLYFQSP